MKVGDVVGEKYELTRLVGTGSMGVVFEARHRLVGQRVAIKVLRPEMASRPEIVTRFLREAQAAAAIGSEHIVQVSDIGETPERTPFLVMELLDGVDLATLIAREGPLPPARAADYVVQVCRGLAAAHARGIVHRDLKPENLMVLRRAGGAEWVKILDFGIAKFREGIVDQATGLTATGATIGTPYYMAPEQLRASKDVDHRADIYSMGVILHELLTGRRPFEADSFAGLVLAVATSEPPPITTLRPGIHPDFDRIARRAMARDIDARFASVTEMAETLSFHLSEHSVARPPATMMQAAPAPQAAPIATTMPLPGPPPQPGGSIWPLLLGLAAVLGVVVLLGVGGAAWWLLTAREPAPAADVPPAPSVPVVPSPVLPPPFLPPAVPPQAGPAVDVTVYAMSRCPYAAPLLVTLTSIARRLGPRMNLTVDYIGTSTNGVLSAMYGENDVQGDMLQLCALRHGTRDSWLDFVSCQSQSFRTIPIGWEGCLAREPALAEAVRACMVNEEGHGLLAASFARSSAAGANGSPTIEIGGQRYSGRRSEADLLAAICARYPAGLAPPLCATAGPEVCDNAVDDDGDGRVDCLDAECETNRACRPERPRSLALFVMAFCPHCAQPIEGVVPVLDLFGRDRSRIDFTLEFVGTVNPDGTLHSMHGDDEVAEDRRQICAQRYYADRYAFMDYVVCRHRDHTSPTWRSCVRPPLSASVIERCVSSGEADELLRASFTRTSDAGIRAAPSWLLNDRFEMRGRTPDAIRADFCGRNPAPECNLPLPLR